MKYKIPATQISKASLLFALGMISSIGVQAAETAAAPDAAEEIVVTGMRAALDKALDVKESNDHVMEALSMDDINGTPAVTIAEALIRLPGVNGSRDRGNESQAAIRGLGPRMVFGTVDGREVASPEPGRSIRYEQYPSELITGAEVYKTQSADLIEGGIAGSINLKTVSPLSYHGPEATIRAGLEQNTSGKDIPEYNPLGNRASATVVEKFLDDTLGFSLGVSEQRQKNGYASLQGWGFSDPTIMNLDGKGSMGNTPWGIAEEVKKLDTKRDGVLSSVEWKPTDVLDIKYDMLYTKVDFAEQQNQTWAQNIGLNPGPWSGWGIEDTNKDGIPNTPLSNVTLVGNHAVAATLNGWEGQIRHVIAGYSQVNTGLSQGLNFSYTGIDTWKIDADIASSTAHRRNYWDAIYLDQYAPTWSYDMQGRPSITAPADSPLQHPEKASYNWINNANEGSSLDDKLTSGQLDFKHDLDAGDLKSVSFGARSANREKEVIWTTFTMNRTDATDNSTNVYFPNGFLTSYKMSAFNAIPILNAPSYERLANLIYGGVHKELATVDSSRYWKVDEHDNAAYVKLDFAGQLGGLDYNANVGVREVDIKTKSYALDGEHIDNDYKQALPSAGLNLSLDDTKKVRFGLSRAISRPPLDELRAGQYISIIGTGNGGSAGNPLLKPFTSDQADVSYEWYFAKESLAAASLYYKKIDNYVGYSTVGVTTSQQGTFNIYGPVNGKGGNVEGAEFTFQMPFNFLPVEGFGVYSNYAYARSDIHEFAPVGNPLPMGGLARDTATLDLWYSKNGLDARLGWKYHSAYTSSFEWDASKLSTLQAELSLGFSLAYDINDHWNVRFQAYNLTNEPAKFYQNNQPENLYRYDDYGRAYLLDFTYKL